MDDKAEYLKNLPRWDLSKLYPSKDSEELANDKAWLKAEIKLFQTKWQGNLETALKENKLGVVLTELEKITEISKKISNYASLLHSTKLDDEEVASFYANIMEEMTNLSNELIFFSLELTKLELDDIIASSKNDKELQRLLPYVHNIFLDKPYQLSEEMETLIAENDIVSQQAWQRLYQNTIKDIRFEFDGKTSNIKEALDRLSSPTEEIRKEAFLAISKTLGEKESTFSLILNSLVKNKEIEDRWRGFKDVADARHLSNKVDGAIVATMVETVQANYKTISHRYFKIKAGWFGAEKLAVWNGGAPMPTGNKDSNHTSFISWEEAKDIVWQAYNDFSPECSKIVQYFYDNNLIDVPAANGKRGGAFMHRTSSKTTPYVLLNYLGKPRDVMVLAHELGHAIHQTLANAQGDLLARPPLTLAETASIFGEMLTFKALLKNITSVDERKRLLAERIEDKIGTVVAQVSFYLFERRVHEARRVGELTSGQINQIWLETQREAVGEFVDLGQASAPLWSYIQHFFDWPFYVYAYSFGDCLVNSLFMLYEKDTPNFKENYFNFLKAGDSKTYDELLTPFGFDYSKAEFWQNGLNLISNLIDELEALETIAIA